MARDTYMNPEETKAVAEYDKKRKEKLNQELAASAQKATTERLTKRGVSKEVAEALAALDKTRLESLRQKLVGVKVPDKLPEGTGEIQLSDEDIEATN